MTKQMFRRRLRVLRPDIQEAQRTFEGKRQWVYLGVGLRNHGPAPVIEPRRNGGWAAEQGFAERLQGPL